MLLTMIGTIRTSAPIPSCARGSVVPWSRRSSLEWADGEGRREARLQVDDVLAREHDDRLDAGVGERPAELREAGCRRRAMLARRALRPAGHVGEMDGRGGEHDVNR